MADDEKKSPARPVGRSPSLLRNFCFTVNNPTPAQVAIVRTFGGDHCSYLVYGRERGEAKQTPHLQGYCELTKRTRFNSVRGLLPPGCHIESRRGKAQVAADYCKKGDQSKAEWESLKEKGPTFGVNADVWECGTLSKQGKRNDLDNVYELVRSGSNYIDLCNDPESFGCAVKFGNLKEVIENVRLKENLDREKAMMLAATLRPWQQRVVDALDVIEAKKDDRSVIWVHDTGAGKGKSFLLKWLCSTKNAQEIGLSSMANMVHGTSVQCDLICIDLPMDTENTCKDLYKFVEALRNGRIYNSKYVAGQRVKCPAWRVVVFANCGPATEKLADDRWGDPVLKENIIRLVDADGGVSRARQHGEEAAEGAALPLQPPALVRSHAQIFSPYAPPGLPPQLCWCGVTLGMCEHSQGQW